MKKMLSILASIGMATTVPLVVVGCSENQQDNSETNKADNEVDQLIKKARLTIGRPKINEENQSFEIKYWGDLTKPSNKLIAIKNALKESFKVVLASDSSETMFSISSITANTITIKLDKPLTKGQEIIITPDKDKFEAVPRSNSGKYIWKY